MLDLNTAIPQRWSGGLDIGYFPSVTCKTTNQVSYSAQKETPLREQ